jgi:hypothetical protein
VGIEEREKKDRERENEMKSGDRKNKTLAKCVALYEIPSDVHPFLSFPVARNRGG